MTPSRPPIKAILFDFMGTCLDWHTGILSALPATLSAAQKSAFALAWRQRYFDACAARVAAGLPVQSIDETHASTLDEMLEREGKLTGEREYGGVDVWTPEARARAVAAWHVQRAWVDVEGALGRLRARGYEMFVFANGSTRLQLDLVRSSNLHFDMLFSSQLLGAYKPTPASYEKCLALLGLDADAVVMVAAHAYDLRGAKKMGLRTVYVHRWTDDVEEDQERVKRENDAWVEDMTGLDEVIAGL